MRPLEHAGQVAGVVNKRANLLGGLRSRTAHVINGFCGFVCGLGGAVERVSQLIHRNGVVFQCSTHGHQVLKQKPKTNRHRADDSGRQQRLAKTARCASGSSCRVTDAEESASQTSKRTTRRDSRTRYLLLHVLECQHRRASGERGTPDEGQSANERTKHPDNDKDSGSPLVVTKP